MARNFPFFREMPDTMTIVARSALAGVLFLAGCASQGSALPPRSQVARMQAARSHSLHHGHKAESPAQDPSSRELVMQAQRELLKHTPSDTAHALALYRQAAAGGDALAQYNLGFCNETGLGVPVSISAASTWYREAAANHKDPAVQRMAAASLATLTKTAANEARQATPAVSAKPKSGASAGM